MNHVDNPFNAPAILSLCTGMRGIERGIERACLRLNWDAPKSIAYVEIEAFVIENLVKQMEQHLLDATPIWSNLKTFPWAAFHGKVHGIIGGYPCQPFSLAGKLGGEEDPRHLWPFIDYGIAAIRPVWCFFENVANHLNIGYETVRQRLQALGYRVKEGIYAAEEAGAPHRRERLFILAIREDCLANAHSFIGGLPEYEQGQGRELPQQNINVERSGQELGNPEMSKCEGCRDSRSGWFGFTDAGDVVADTNIQQWWQQQSNGRGEPAGAWNQLEGCSENVAYTYDCRSWENFQQSQLWSGWVKQSPCNCGIGYEAESEEGGFDRWPARPGEPQHEWERPRITEPGLGCTINGYNFREDLLRLYGNGVVEQIAEIAFIDLLRKHAEDVENLK